MTENEEFASICKEAMAKLEVGKTLFAEEYLELDPKTFKKYCTEGSIPKKIWAKALSLATGVPKEQFENQITKMFRLLYEKAIKKNIT